MTPVAVEVWVARLDGLPLDTCREALTPDERERAGRFAFALDAERFAKQRAVRRSLLALRTGLSSAEMHFGSLSNGKPYLVGSPETAFSVSHSQHIMLLAFSAKSPVGVDIESITPGTVDASISSMAFSRDEVRFLHSLPAPSRCDTFYRWWVRKEAIAKGTGEGVSALRNIVMPLREVTSLETLVVGGWCTCDLEIEDGFAAAVATEGLSPIVSTREFTAASLANI